MRIVAVPRDENDILAEDRTRVAAWSPANGWTYLEYVDIFDLLSLVRDQQASAPQRVAEIEIVAHGNPAVCNDVVLGNAAVVGESLRRLEGISGATAVYLSGCNTRLELNGECIARSFAATFEGPVFGSRGYITGTHAERTERCLAAFELDESCTMRTQAAPMQLAIRRGTGLVDHRIQRAVRTCRLRSQLLAFAL